MKEAEEHKALFHRWVDIGIDSHIGVFGLVEYEDGTIHLVNAVEIRLTDRIKTEIGIDEKVFTDFMKNARL